MKRPSARQLEMLAFIKGYKREHVYAPCYEEIMQACGISSKSVVRYNLQWLAQMRLIQWEPAIARSIVLPGERELMALA